MRHFDENHMFCRCDETEEKLHRTVKKGMKWKKTKQVRNDFAIFQKKELRQTARDRLRKAGIVEYA